MTRDDLAPIAGDEHESFPCEACGGSGRYAIQGLPVWGRCGMCGGSGYGPPPVSADRERHHCLERLSRWARRMPLPEEN